MSPTRIIAILLLVAAIAVIAIGVVYFTVQAGNLPSFMGRVANSGLHRNRRAIAAVVLGVVLLIASVVAFSRSRQPSS
jgi:amino acid permease